MLAPQSTRTASAEQYIGAKRQFSALAGAGGRLRSREVPIKFLAAITRYVHEKATASGKDLFASLTRGDCIITLTTSTAALVSQAGACRNPVDFRCSCSAALGSSLARILSGQVYAVQ